MLLRGPVGVPDHPVPSPPVVFDDFVVDDPEHFDSDLDPPRPSVGIAIHDMDTLVHRRPRRRRLDIGDGIEDASGGGASITISRDARTATISKLSYSTNPLCRLSLS